MTRAHGHTGTRADFFFGMYQLETRFARIILDTAVHVYQVRTVLTVHSRYSPDTAPGTSGIPGYRDIGCW